MEFKVIDWLLIPLLCMYQIAPSNKIFYQSSSFAATSLYIKKWKNPDTVYR